MKYEVAIVSKRQNTYIIEAKSDDEAFDLAKAKFDNGQDGDLPAFDYESIEHIATRQLNGEERAL